MTKDRELYAAAKRFLEADAVIVVKRIQHAMGSTDDDGRDVEPPPGTPQPTVDDLRARHEARQALDAAMRSYETSLSAAPVAVDAEGLTDAVLARADRVYTEAFEAAGRASLTTSVFWESVRAAHAAGLRAAIVDVLAPLVEARRVHAESERRRSELSRPGGMSEERRNAEATERHYRERVFAIIDTLTGRT